MPSYWFTLTISQVRDELSAREIIESHSKGIGDSPNGDANRQLNAWQMLPELPAAGELTAMDPPPLPTAMTNAKVPSKEEYLEFQYRLQRYEGTELLRRAVSQYRDDPNMMDSQEAFIYTQVRFSLTF